MDMPSIVDAAMSLPEGERAKIAYQLLHSLSPPSLMTEEDPSLRDELKRRLDAYDAGETQASDLDSVSDRMKKSLNGRKST